MYDVRRGRRCRGRIDRGRGVFTPLKLRECGDYLQINGTGGNPVILALSTLTFLAIHTLNRFFVSTHLWRFDATVSRYQPPHVSGRSFAGGVDSFCHWPGQCAGPEGYLFWEATHDRLTPRYAHLITATALVPSSCRSPGLADSRHLDSARPGPQGNLP